MIDTDFSDFSLDIEDVTRAIGVLVVIFGGNFIGELINIQSNIERNWPKHRCNPIIMPFADMFGHNSKENFIYCMQSIQKNYMGYLTQPFQYGLDLMTDVGTELNKSINSIRRMINYLQAVFSNIITNVFGVIFNLVVEMQRIIIGIKDMVKSLSAVMATLIFLLEGVMHTFNSLWNGPPGQGIRWIANAIN